MDKKITIIGCGPGDKDLMTIRGQRAIESADVIVGSKRLLDNFNRKSGVITFVLKDNYNAILEEVDRIRSDKNTVFLVSGDPLFHSFGKAIIKRFGKKNCEVIPGISSFQYAFSRLKESWEDYRILSLHGEEDVDLDAIFEGGKKFLLLLDPKHNLKYLKRRLKSTPDSGRRFYIASNLSLPTENITNISFDDFEGYPEESLSILIVT